MLILGMGSNWNWLSTRSQAQVSLEDSSSSLSELLANPFLVYQSSKPSSILGPQSHMPIIECHCYPLIESLFPQGVVEHPTNLVESSSQSVPLQRGQLFLTDVDVTNRHRIHASQPQAPCLGPSSQVPSWRSFLWGGQSRDPTNGHHIILVQIQSSQRSR